MFFVIFFYCSLFILCGYPSVIWFSGMQELLARWVRHLKSRQWAFQKRIRLANYIQYCFCVMRKNVKITWKLMKRGDKILWRDGEGGKKYYRFPSNARICPATLLLNSFLVFLLFSGSASFILTSLLRRTTNSWYLNKKIKIIQKF